MAEKLEQSPDDISPALQRRVDAISVERSPNPNTALFIARQYNTAFIDDRSLVTTAIEYAKKEEMPSQPVSGVTEKLSAEHFEKVLAQEGVFVLRAKSGSFMIMRKLPEDIDLEEEFGTFTVSESRKPIADRTKESHKHGTLYSVVELSSNSSIETAALLLRLKQELPEDAFVIAKVLDSVKIGNDDLDDALFMHGGNKNGLFIAERMGMTYFGSNVASRALSIPHELAKEAFPKYCEYYKKKSHTIPAKLGFNILGGRFNLVMGAVAKNPTQIPLYNFPQRNQSRRNFLATAAICSSVTLCVVTIINSVSKSSNAHIETDGSTVRKLSLFGNEWNYNEDALPSKDGELVPLLSYPYQDSQERFSVLGFQCNGEPSFAMTNGQQTLAIAHKKGDRNTTKPVWFYFNGEDAESNEYAPTDSICHIDTINEKKEPRLNYKLMQLIAKTDPFSAAAIDLKNVRLEVDPQNEDTQLYMNQARSYAVNSMHLFSNTLQGTTIDIASNEDLKYVLKYPIQNSTCIVHTGADLGTNDFKLLNEAVRNRTIGSYVVLRQ